VNNRAKFRNEAFEFFREIAVFVVIVFLAAPYYRDYIVIPFICHALVYVTLRIRLQVGLRVCLTRLPFNLRLTTCECVHFVTVMWQRWRLYHSICHSQKLHATHKLHGCMFYTVTELLTIEVLHCESRDFRRFCSCDLDLIRWPSYTNSTRIHWRYNGCANMNFLR